MKNLFCVFTTLLLVLFAIGCDSSDNDTIDNSAIREFIDFGSDLNDYLWDLDLGRAAYTLEDPETATQDEKDDYAAMLRDTFLQRSYCDLVYDIVYEFDPVLVNDNVYTDRTRDNRPSAPTRITLSGRIYTLETNYYGYTDDPEKFESLKATMIYDAELNKWLLKAYRGTTEDSIWLLQEGVLVTDTWYVSFQRVDNGTNYKTNFMLTNKGTSVILSLCGQTNSGAITQGTLYSHGITTANDEWSEFRNFEITPDYEFPE